MVQSTTLAEPLPVQKQIASRHPTAGSEVSGENATAPTSGTDSSPTYENLALDDLIEEAGHLRQQLSDAKTPLLLAELNEGRSEYVGPDYQYNGRKEDRTDVFAIHYVPGKGTYRSLLSRAQFPELYELRQQIEEIERIIIKRQFAASQTATADRHK